MMKYSIYQWITYKQVACDVQFPIDLWYWVLHHVFGLLGTHVDILVQMLCVVLTDVSSLHSLIGSLLILTRAPTFLWYLLLPLFFQIHSKVLILVKTSEEMFLWTIIESLVSKFTDFLKLLCISRIILSCCFNIDDYSSLYLRPKY